MTYLQALRTLVKAYKAARGVMPKGIDLLKMKMKARRKAIDSNKVVEFPKDKITPFFKPRPRSESEAQMLTRMKRENKEAAQRLRDKKKPREDKAEGGVTSAIKKIKKRFGKKSITTGDKIKRPGNRQLFDDFKKRNKFNIGGNVRRNVTPQPRDPRLQNLIDVYESNPTLQSSMSVDDYLMQAYRPTTPTTEELATGVTTQATQPVIKPIKPIIPIPESGDGGGITTIGRGRTASNQPNYMGGKEPGIVAALQRTIGEIKDSPVVKYNPLNPMFIYNLGKAGLEKARDFAEQVQKQKALEEAQERARLADELARQMNQVYYDNPGADFTGGRYDGASSRSEYESNPTGFSGSS